MRASERHWVSAWHVPLNVAAMHVSGVLLYVSSCWIPAASTETYAQTFEMMISVERFKYSVQTLAMWALLRPPRRGCPH